VKEIKKKMKHIEKKLIHPILNKMQLRVAVSSFEARQFDDEDENTASSEAVFQ